MASIQHIMNHRNTELLRIFNRVVYLSARCGRAFLIYDICYHFYVHIGGAAPGQLIKRFYSKNEVRSCIYTALTISTMAEKDYKGILLLTFDDMMYRNNPHMREQARIAIQCYRYTPDNARIVRLTSQWQYL